MAQGAIRLGGSSCKPSQLELQGKAIPMEQATTLVPSVTCKTSTARCKVCPVFHVDFSLNYVKVSEFSFGLAWTQVLAAIAIEQTMFEP